MLRGFRDKVIGAVSPSLRRDASDDVRGHFERLICEALQKWSAENFYVYCPDELCYSVRLFYFCELAIEQLMHEVPIMHVFHDALQPTRSMLLGAEHPSHSPRPDFSVVIGAVKFRVEAKRLRLSGGLPGLYVRNGMMRFLDGRYGSTPPFPGIMVGYVEADTTDAIVDKVNEVIDAQTGLGVSHRLVSLPAGAGHPHQLRVYQSSHGGTLTLRHYEVDVT